MPYQTWRKRNLNLATSVGGQAGATVVGLGEVLEIWPGNVDGRDDERVSIKIRERGSLRRTGRPNVHGSKVKIDRREIDPNLLEN